MMSFLLAALAVASAPGSEPAAQPAHVAEALARGCVVQRHHVPAGKIGHPDTRVRCPDRTAERAVLATPATERQIPGNQRD